jgi:hypothetical protein
MLPLGKVGLFPVQVDKVTSRKKKKEMDCYV